jgi:hypothetical protein
VTFNKVACKEKIAIFLKTTFPLNHLMDFLRTFGDFDKMQQFRRKRQCALYRAAAAEQAELPTRKWEEQRSASASWLTLY